MARLTNRLAAKTVSTVKKVGMHADGAGLYLRVDASGARRWVFVYQWKGARKEMGLGGFPGTTLEKARKKASAARELVEAGINPVEARRLEVQANEGLVTFGDVADRVLKKVQGEVGKKQYQGWHRSLFTLCMPIRSKSVVDIDISDVLTILEPIWTTIGETAERTRSRMEHVLDVAKLPPVSREGANPAAWKGNLKLVLSKRSKLSRGHHAALHFDEAGDFMAKLRARPALAARALEFTILTAARTGEALGATWREIDLDKKVWTIPAERMKGREEHDVPLTAPAVDVLRALPGANEQPPDAYLFPGQIAGKPLSDMSMLMLLRRMGLKKITVHGFRSTFSDWVGDKTEFAAELAEFALAHQVGGKSSRSYRRRRAVERRRKLMSAWAGYLGKVRVNNVVGFSRVA